MKLEEIRRVTKQQEALAAALRELDPDVAQGFRELAVEPLALCEAGDYLSAAKHIEWLKLDDSEMLIFWRFFDSTQRAKMKAARDQS